MRLYFLYTELPLTAINIQTKIHLNSFCTFHNVAGQTFIMKEMAKWE